MVIDASGGLYDEHGKVLNTAKGSAFEKLFGAELADVQYSNNVPSVLASQRLAGFVWEISPNSARVVERFQTGEPAYVENRIGKGSAAVLGWDASHALFKPGATELEKQLLEAATGGISSPYSCAGAVAYRLAGAQADHYFVINDDEPKEVRLTFRSYQYRSVTDPVSGEKLDLAAPVKVEGYSGRWLRYEK